MKILFACGGTGGHIIPGLALAEVFEKRIPGAQIVFVGTKRGLEQKIIGSSHWRLKMMHAVSFADKKGFGKITALFGYVISLFSAVGVLIKERPDLVIGVGGYVAAPILMMARFFRKTVVTLEPNAFPGMANRFLGVFVDLVVVAFPGMEKFFPSKKIRLLGIPVRQSLYVVGAQKNADERIVVLVMGGSQGARAINETIFQMLPLLTTFKEKLHFIHQVGAKADLKFSEEQYRALGFSAEVYPFIENMGAIYNRTSFVIARAGAITVAELMALKKPSLLIPFPFAAHNHQEANARALEATGGAQVVLEKELTKEKLFEVIKRWIEHPNILKQMTVGLEKLGNNNASEDIVNECLKRMHLKHV